MPVSSPLEILTPVNDWTTEGICAITWVTSLVILVALLESLEMMVNLSAFVNGFVKLAATSGNFETIVYSYKKRCNSVTT